MLHCMSRSLGCTACSLLNAWSGIKKRMRNGVTERKKKYLPRYFSLALCSVCCFVNRGGKMCQLWKMWWERQVGSSREGITSVLGNAAATFTFTSMPLRRGAKQSLLSHFDDAEAQLLENLRAVAGLWVNWRLGFCWCEAACWLA